MLCFRQLFSSPLLLYFYVALTRPSCGHAFTDSIDVFCSKCGVARGVQQNSSLNQGNQQYVASPISQPGKGKAIASFVLGLGAMTIPIPVLDIIIGVVGLILAISSKNDGYIGGIRTAGFVCSILGIIWATIFTVTILSGAMTFLMF